MLENVTPGDRINIKIVNQPTNRAAQKTLVRLLSKDPEVKQENRRQEKVRKTNLTTKQRGGRQWAQRLVKQRPVAGNAGESGTVVATVDVLRDLGSVQRFVEVGKA